MRTKDQILSNVIGFRQDNRVSEPFGIKLARTLMFSQIYTSFKLKYPINQKDLQTYLKNVSSLTITFKRWCQEVAAMKFNTIFNIEVYFKKSISSLTYMHMNEANDLLNYNLPHVRQ